MWGYLGREGAMEGGREGEKKRAKFAPNLIRETILLPCLLLLGDFRAAAGPKEEEEEEANIGRERVGELSPNVPSSFELGTFLIQVWEESCRVRFTLSSAAHANEKKGQRNYYNLFGKLMLLLLSAFIAT